jgi:hypothetical protein
MPSEFYPPKSADAAASGLASVVSTTRQPSAGRQPSTDIAEIVTADHGMVHISPF